MARKRFTSEERRLRQQYSKTSRRIRQQLKRLNEKYPNNNLQRYYSGEFPTLKEIGNISIKGLKLLNKRANEVYRSELLTSRKYSQSLIKSATTLRDELGFEFVNEGNIEGLWNFIDDMRARGLADIYGYKYFIGMYNRISRSDIDWNSTIEEWTDYAEKYNDRKARALSSGKEVPQPKRLKAKRKSSNS